MKLKNIHIKNFGCIKEFKYECRFDENGNPIPLILIGQNGSGKSLIIANIIDALIETKRNLYNTIPEVKESNYFKVGKKSYINKNSFFSKVNIDFNCENNKTLQYTDIMCSDIDKLKADFPDITNEVKNDEKFKENGFFKKVKNILKEDEFTKDCYIYFPVDRYYVPNWFNEDNYQKLNYDDDSRFIGKSSQNIIKTNVLSNIKKWLYDLFLSRDYQIVVSQKGEQFAVPINSDITNNVLTILKTIKNDSSIVIPKYSYKNSNFPISGQSLDVSDLNNVSSGEAMLISLFLSLIKEFDFNNHNFELKDISGICVIDEIDLNLHIHQQEKILPKLIKLFPKVQFIITSHSPFFVEGMKNTFGNNCDIINMPNGTKLNDILDFSEVIDTIKLFNVDGENFCEYTKDLKNQLKKISEEKNKITILTEGKTDASFIIKAFEKLNIPMPNIEIRGLDEKTDGQSGDKTLRKILEVQRTLNNKLIAIFDRDNDEILKYLKTDTNDFLNVLDGKVYAFAIPTPKGRNNDDKISIEHYFTDTELQTEDENGRRLYFAKEFNQVGVSLDNTKLCKYLVHNKNKVSDIYVLSGSDDKKVTDLNGTKNYSLSKADFCHNVCNQVNNFDKLDFENFRLIIDKITHIISLIK